jgi:hypothetical protein
MAQKQKLQASKSQHKELRTWAILHVGDKLKWLGDVVAYDADAAIAEAEKKLPPRQNLWAI